MLNPLAKAGEGLTEIFGRFSRNPCSSPIQWVRAKNGVMKDPQWRKHLNVESKKTYDEGTVAKLLGVGMLVVGGLLADVQRVENLLNNRPRKTLGYHSPNEVFDKLTDASQNYALGM